MTAAIQYEITRIDDDEWSWEIMVPAPGQRTNCEINGQPYRVVRAGCERGHPEAVAATKKAMAEIKAERENA